MAIAAKATTSPDSSKDSFELPEIPLVDRVAGTALQGAIDDLNRAYINVMRVAALLGPAEPLAPDLLDVPQQVIELFSDSRVVDRMLDMSFGFPLVKARIRDHHLVERMVKNGSGDSDAIRAFTDSFSLDVVTRATKKRRLP
ncbi:hypothetical protein [Hydrogenophaga sp. NFH-34]|uniref:hypothetical protein n=1 Tax=Hydrogenophaga sp. NFH-34 TaxID=2744446 RepID=UPI001F3C1D63|nr:hypothetical protein [Hydrogenophaga sp. NFH-34]